MFCFHKVRADELKAVLNSVKHGYLSVENANLLYAVPSRQSIVNL